MMRILLLVVALTSCATAPVRPIEVLPVNGLQGRAYRGLGAVRGRSCAWVGAVSSPSEAVARRDLERAAADVGADGIIAVQCAPVSMHDDQCGGMSGFACIGDAFVNLSR